MNKLIQVEFDGVSKATIQGNVAKFDYPCTSTTTCKPYTVFFFPGRYQFELYGAQGGDGRFQNTVDIRKDSGGKGAYVSGVLNIIKGTTMFFYIGGKGEDQTSTAKGSYGIGGFNGGGNGGADTCENTGPESNAGGGGATDIRLINSQSYKGLKSRIIVAAGGGSGISTNTKPKGGAGGELIGNAPTAFVIPGSQNSGSFGKGQNGISIGCLTISETVYFTGGSTGGGGGGYYGGSTLKYEQLPTTKQYIETSGAGGSSFISGYRGCNAVQYDKKETSTIIHTGRRYHYSGYVFKKPIMMSGLKTFHKPGSTETEVGHTGNGFIVITYIGHADICSRYHHRHYNNILYNILLCTLIIPR